MGRQKLIHLNASGSTKVPTISDIEYGEIAVNYSQDAPKLFIKAKKDGESDSIVEFIDAKKITGITEEIKGDVESLSSTVTEIKDTILSGYNTSNKVKDDVTRVENIATGRTNGVTVDSDNNGTYVHLTATTADDKSVKLSISEKIVNITAATEDNNGFATAYDIRTELGKLPTSELASRVALLEHTVSGTTDPQVDGLIQKVSANTDSITTLNADSGTSGSVAEKVATAINTLKGGYSGTLNDVNTLASNAESIAKSATAMNVTQSSAIATLEEKTDGFDLTRGSIKTYVDSKVSSVYKFQGSVDTYDELTAKTEQARGYVWNVISACTVSGKSYSEGTNFAYISETSGLTGGENWDALGGTVDLSAYMKTESFNTWTANTYTSKITALENTDSTLSGRIGALEAISGHTNDALTGVTGLVKTDSTDYLGASATTENNVGQLTYWAKIKAMVDASSENKGLAEASDVKSYISTVSGSLNTEIESVKSSVTTLSNKVGTGLTESDSITDSLKSVKATADSAIQGVSAESKTSSYISAYTETDSANGVNVIISGNVCSDIDSAENGQLADANAVKTKISNVQSSLESEIDTVSERASQGVNGVQFTGLTGTASTDYVQDETTKIKVKINPVSGSTVNMQFDFSDMVIDCGTFE